jgi:hypothetical protein
MQFIKKHSALFCTLLIIILLSVYMRMWFTIDENYSLDLVKHSYSSIIHIDSYDIHPPLYYIVLKFFLGLVLPFKHNFILEVIFSRIFSILCSLLSVIFYIKIIRYFNIKIKKSLVFLFFFLIPNVLFIDNMNFSESTNIRMYSLAGLFVVATWYFIIKFNQDGKLRNAFLFLLLAELSAYTHYYAAVMSGLFLFMYFIYFLKMKKYKYSITFFISGVLFLLMYIPWIIYGVLHQFRALVFSTGLYKSLAEIIVASFLFIVFLMPLFYLYKKLGNDKKIDLLILVLDNMIILAFTGLYSIIKSPIFLIRYIYPSMIILEMVAVAYAIYQFNNDKKKHRIISILCVYCLPMLAFVSFVHEIVRVAPISVEIYQNDIAFSKTKSKYVNISEPKRNVQDFDFNGAMVNPDTLHALYLRSIDKTPYLTNKKRYEYDITTKNYPTHLFVPKPIKYINKNN